MWLMSDLSQHSFFPCELNGVVQDKRKGNGGGGGGGGRGLMNRVKQRQTLEEQPTFERERW